MSNKSDKDEEYDPTFVTITDEEGNDYELEYVDTFEFNGSTYMVFFPAELADEEEEEEPADDSEDEDEEEGLIIFKVVVENGEYLLEAIEDENELNEVYDEYMESIFDEDEEDDEDE